MITATYWWRVQHLLNHNLFTILDVDALCCWHAVELAAIQCVPISRTQRSLLNSLDAIGSTYLTYNRLNIQLAGPVMVSLRLAKNFPSNVFSDSPMPLMVMSTSFLLVLTVSATGVPRPHCWAMCWQK